MNDNFTKMFMALIVCWGIIVILGAIMVFKGPDPEPEDARFQFREADAEIPPGNKYKVEESEGEAAAQPA